MVYIFRVLLAFLLTAVASVPVSLIVGPYIGLFTVPAFFLILWWLSARRQFE